MRRIWSSRWTSTVPRCGWDSDGTTFFDGRTSTQGQGMNKKQMSHIEKRLLEERARVMKELGYYDESFNTSLQGADGDLSSYSFHMADQGTDAMERDRKSTRLNSSHSQISYAVFCLKKKK